MHFRCIYQKPQQKSTDTDNDTDPDTDNDSNRRSIWKGITLNTVDPFIYSVLNVNHKGLNTVHPYMTLQCMKSLL